MLDTRTLAAICTVLSLVPSALAADAAADALFSRLISLCGTRYEGMSSFPSDGPFRGRALVAEILECSDGEVRVPFTVGEDRSRTWIVTRSEDGLLLKHDHRHADGTPDEITMYGGWATSGGSALSQSFAADDYTKELLPEAATNVWTLSLTPDADQLTYSLERHAKPRFKATLDRVRAEVDVNEAFAPLAWLVGRWRAAFRPMGEELAAPTMSFAWGDEKRSYLTMSGTQPTPDGGLEPEYDGFVVWHPVRQRFEFLTSYRSGSGEVTEDGEIEVLQDGAVRLFMHVHYPPGAKLPFGEGEAGPSGRTLEFQRTFHQDGAGGLRGVFRIQRGGEWVDPLPDLDHAAGFEWHRSGPLAIRLANATEKEREARRQLERLTTTFDLAPWLFTRDVVIDEDDPIPHSHPVLTLNADSLDDDHAQLATLIHEQMHWFRGGRAIGFDAALADLRALFPEVPSGRAGARNERSTYSHLIICDLELQGLTKVVGEPEARRVLSGWQHYTWIYNQVLNNPKVREITERHGLVVPEAGEVDAAND